MGTLELVTRGPEDTRALGEALAEVMEPGDVVSLTGDLGAGKTTLVQGLCRGLGVTEPVLSPTFTLVREYEGRLRVYHVDVYRLDRLQEVVDLGFPEILEAGGLVLVEWGDAVESLLPESHLQVELTIPPADEDVRLLAVSPRGPGWARRHQQVEAALAPWRAERRAGGGPPGAR
ncbi:MAG TPA: tRNA (adenosine(37)-N6)-threonylcarbamoyltransferase complex ATPase subunit type 1 TsaE [Actinomycetota bacterium]|nr:tRNA (adenosine(37)-N6)-threonylcarbamoyltransferase complex ATPase subunit type 1 TsaE [Actinomycetota bacterium]